MGNIFTIVMNMPSGIKGHVNANKDGSYTVFINARLNFEQQREVYMHEVNHIINNDFDKENVDIIERRAHERIYY